MSGYVPDEIIEEIRSNNDIVDVVSEYIRLERKGKSYSGLCPFHKEKSPSFSVVPAEQYFYCFGCGKGGNVINFIMGVENLDYGQSIRLLAERAKIQIPEGDNYQDKEKVRLKEELLKLNKEAARYFYRQLLDKDNKKARDYISSRGITYDTVKKFGLGYQSENWDNLYKYLSSLGYRHDLLEKSGLFIRNKNGGFTDKFKNRIMFPIFDLRGNVIAFGGRAIGGENPKYMNSPETLVYSKSKNLYALNIAKSNCKDFIIIVEGYMDVISLHQYGIINTVASLGTALTDNQAKLLKKYSNEVIIAYDADSAGQAATLRGLDILNEAGCNVKVLTVPQGKDPDEFIKKNGQESFRRLIERSESLIDYKVRMLKKSVDVSTVEGKITFLRGIASILSKVDSGVEREIYVRTISREYAISEESLMTEILKGSSTHADNKKIIVNNNNTVKARVKTDLINSNKEEKQNHLEKMLLAFIMIDNSVYLKLKNLILLDYFEDDELKDTASKIFNRLSQGNEVFVADAFNLFNESTAGDIARIIREECNCDDNIKAVLDIIKKMEQTRLEKRQQEILKVLAGSSDNIEGDVERLKREFQEITTKIKNL